MSTYSPRHNNKHPVYFFTVLFILSLLLFLPGFSLFFHQDDFIHMMHSRTWEQVFDAFNLFWRGEFPFYRPIPTQVYFFFLGKIFGLHPFGYHLVNFLIYSINTIMVYRLGVLLTRKWRAGAIASLIYAINSTHVASLFSAAYVHELLYVSFGLLTVITYLRYLRKERSVLLPMIFFVLALMTKENAVVLPGILAIVTLWLRYAKGKLFPLFKQTIINLRSFIFILAIYLYGHFAYYGTAASSSYSVIIGKETAKILLWYFLWALSVPNILIDFLQPGMKLSPLFFQVAGMHAYVFLMVFPILLTLLAMLVWCLILLPRGSHGFRFTSACHPRGALGLACFGIVWFVIAMIPLLPFPLHHLATEQAFGLVGLAIGLGLLVERGIRSGRWGKLTAYGFMGIYLFHAANTIILAQKTHWIVRSSQQAGRVIGSLRTDPPIVTAGKTLVFLDGEIKIPEYGSSRQIYEALGNGSAITIFFGEGISQLYEFKDAIDKEDVSGDRIILDSSQFLGY